MTFSELTEEQKNYIKKVYLDKTKSWQERMTELTKYLGATERTIRRWCSNKLKLKEKPDHEPDQYLKAKLRKFDKTKKYLIITWGQNNTEVHKGFYTNIEAYADYLNADIHIILGRYKNPTSVFEDREEDFWVDEVDKYKDANRHNIHKYLSVLSDVKIQPTATNPMSGMQGMSGINSCIFGGPKVQMEMIPVLDGNLPKMMLSTGAVTLMNYTDSKAGKKGEFHHTFGFCIVEIKDKETFFVRHVTADDKTGSFSDLFHRVENGKVTKLNTISAIVLGDVHYGHHDEEVLKETMKMLNKIKPDHVILHDVFDGNSISHHEMKDPFVQYGKEVMGTNDLGKEINIMMTGLKEFEKFKNVVIVRSNHDDFLDRWLKNEDWKKQPTFKNAPLYMELSSKLLAQYGKNPYDVKGVIPQLINEKYPKFKTLGRNSSYKVNNWELGQHGDFGPNGSRGSLLGFRKLNTKIIVGHYHCLPAEYKVQTKNSGWKEIRAIKNGDEILSYDPITNTNIWNIVNEFIEIDYDGIMLQINGNGFEQTFTDKHMLMLSDGSYIPASEAICSRSAYELPLSANPEISSGIDISENNIRRLVAIAADGSQDSSRIRFRLKKERKIERLKKLFGEDLEIYSDEVDNFDGYISTKSELYKELISVKYNLKSIKNISVEILDWNSKSLEILIDELKYWDGTFDSGNNGRQYSTTNKMECNVISSALNRLGYSHTVLKKENENENHKTLNIITWCNDRNFYRSTRKLNHDNRFNSWGFHSYQAKCKVYCVSVPNKCFWVQSAKTGQVSLTGNSPGRKDGALAVGTSTKLRVGYNIGPSSWLQSHVIIHNDGKAQHINFVNNEYTTFK